MRSAIRRAALGWLVAAVMLPAPPAAGAPRKDGKDIAVDPTSRGRVLGQVYDAATGLPVQDALVVVQQDGVFPEADRARDRTDAQGRYRTSAVIGRVSENFDVGRALASGVVGLLLGSATNRTRRIDISRLPVRITRDGYRPFEGVVLCRSLNAEAFTVTLQPILLAPASDAGVSTTADGWGVARIATATIEPPVLRPGARATIAVTVACPPVLKAADVKVRCTYRIGERDYAASLQPRASSDPSTLAFAGEIAAPGGAVNEAAIVTAALVECPYDIAERGETALALLQVAGSDAATAAAAGRAAAFARMQARDNVAACAAFRTLCAGPSATVLDCDCMAALCRALHDDAGAVDALKRAVELTPAKPEALRFARMSRLAAGLVANREGARVAAECQPIVDSVKEADRPKRIPVEMMIALGEAHLQQGRLDDAAAVSTALMRWPDAGLSPRAGEFRGALRLARAEARVKAEPASPGARAERGRALMDLGRWEEASEDLRAAIAADPALHSARRDLAYAGLHLQEPQAPAPDAMDIAIAAAERETQSTDPKGKTVLTRDFMAWHTLGMLLYAQARQQEAAASPAASATMARCRETLRTALKCARSGAAVTSGMYSSSLGYLSERVVAIAGFAYPEADSDYVVLDSLRTLETHPGDTLAHYALGAALLHLGQPALARPPIRRALELQPGFLDAVYVDALIARRLGERDAAATGLRNVLARNPRHPRANLALAEMLTEDGDAAAAAACLAAHARTYGAAR